MKDWPRCVHCGGTGDPESPFKVGVVYDVNPLTLRMAWQHGDCYEEALAEAQKDANGYDRFQEKLLETSPG